MPIYEIPLFERSTRTNLYPDNVACIEVDSYGIVVHYKEESELEVSNIRRHLIGKSDTRCYIEAEDVVAAIAKFYKEFKCAKIGGPELNQKALWINTKKPIIELTQCERMHRNSQDRFICGEPVDKYNGEFGGCILEDYYPSDNCPIDDCRGKEVCIPTNQMLELIQEHGTGS